MKRIIKKTEKIWRFKKISFFIYFAIFLISFIIIAYTNGYVTGYKKGTSLLADALKSHTLKENIRNLYSEKINNISVYSDFNNFSRIEKIIKDLNITFEKYDKLTGIIYFQNKSIDGYYEHISDASCDGTYDIYGSFVELYKCDGTLHIRDLNVSEKNSEKAILLHELGHYELSYDSQYQQEMADEYARENLK